MQVKRCPSCGGEFFASVTECADCEVPLVSPEEYGRGKRSAAGSLDPAAGTVVVREGQKEWIEELAEVLRSSGVACRIGLAPGCSPGGCGTTYRILVMEEDYRTALAVVETYYRDMYPELAEAQAGMSEGACPACGHKAGMDAPVCPECGLVLVMEEKDSAQED